MIDCEDALDAVERWETLLESPILELLDDDAAIDRDGSLAPLIELACTALEEGTDCCVNSLELDARFGPFVINVALGGPEYEEIVAESAERDELSEPWNGRAVF